MKKVPGRMWVVAALGIAVCVAAGISRADVSMSRAQALEQLQGRIVLTGSFKAMLDKDQKDFIEALGVSRIAKEVLPARLTFRTQREMDAVLKAFDVRLSTPHSMYSSLVVRRQMMEVVINAATLRQMPVLSDTEVRGMKEAIAGTVQKANSIVCDLLGRQIDKAAIDRATSGLAAKLTRDVEYPLTFAMKVPMDPRRLEDQLRAFAERLSVTRDYVTERLGRASGGLEDVNMRAARQEEEVRRILDEVLLPLRFEIMKATAWAPSTKINPDDYAPGYSQVLGSIQKLEGDFRRQEEIAEKRRRRVQKIEAAINAEPEAIARVELSQLPADLVEIPSQPASPESRPLPLSLTSAPQQVASRSRPPHTGKNSSSLLTWALVAGVFLCLAAAYATLVRSRKKTKLSGKGGVEPEI